MPRQIPDDEYARESFTFRRMHSWQITALIAILLVLLLLAARGSLGVIRVGILSRRGITQQAILPT